MSVDEVAGYCPMGCGPMLRLDARGRVVCGGAMCPRPDAVEELLADPETEHVVELGEYGYNLKHPLRERLGDELLSCTLGAAIGASAPGDLPAPGRYRVPAFDQPWERL